ncbi:MAG: ATP-binding protein [Gemmatimonadaceae bacterium]
MTGFTGENDCDVEHQRTRPENESTFRTERSARLRAEEAERIAEEANRAKSTFLAVMSHELRTPLNAMIGYTQLLDIGLAGTLTKKQRDYVSRLSASTEHLLGLVNDVLDLSRLEAGGTRVARSEALTSVATFAALDLVEPLAAARGVRLLNARRKGIPYIGDEDRVRQIIVNLLSNAVKFSEQGDTVTIRCGVHTDTPHATQLRSSGPWSYIRVEDTGAGIPPEELARIFQPFHQVESGHTRVQGGTGLGLAISRQLAQLMGGEITVESTVGTGSAFTLWLPNPRQPLADGERDVDSATNARAERVARNEELPGLRSVGEILAHSIREILDAYTAGLRADPAIPLARDMPSVQLEDHAVSLLADLAQSVTMLAEGGTEAVELLRDGGVIQRAIADAHGARRYAQGWDEPSVRRDHAILHREVERGIRGRLTEPDADTEAALRIIATLSERAEVISVRGWRRSAERAADARLADRTSTESRDRNMAD